MAYTTPWLTDNATGIVKIRNAEGDTYTASGNPVTVNNQWSRGTVDDLSVDIEPIQPNQYDSVWVGGAGKNLLKTDGLVLGTPSNTSYSNNTKRTFQTGIYINGLAHNNYYSVRATGVVVTNNSVKFTTPANAYGVAIPLIGLEVGQYYTVSANKTNGNIGLSFYAEDGTYLAYQMSIPANDYCTVSVPSDTYYTCVVFNAQQNDVESTFTNIQLEKSSTKTDYAPYENICPITGSTSATVTVTNGDDTDTYTVDMTDAGTVYGGTLDVTTGVLTVTHKYAEYNGSENWALYSPPNYDATFWLIIVDKKVGAFTSISNEFENIENAWSSAGTGKYGVYSDHNSLNRIYVRYPNAETDTVEKFKTWLASNPMQLVYELETPLTYTLTAEEITLLTGTNTFTTDMDSIDITYTLPGWTSLIDPSSLKHDVYDLDAGGTTGRNLAGEMLRDRVAVKEKLEMEFPLMYASDYYKMLDMIKDQFFDVMYYSPFTGGYRVATMYVGDREGEPYYEYDSNNPGTNKWQNIKFNFIER